VAPEKVEVEVGERKLMLSNLDKILYPETGFTKAQVIDYYVRIAPTMLAHIRDRGITLIRFPDGVDGNSFFSKRCVDWRPDWLPAEVGPGHSDGRAIEYCCLNEVAALAWTANLAALEIHSPMARVGDIESPTMVVFDLDPGPGTSIVECCQVALDIRAVLDTLDLSAVAKTSGSKGMQLYVPLNTPHTHQHASSFAKALAQLLEKQAPDRVVSNMAKKLRAKKIFIDWSQNSRHKTTVAPYSMRAKPAPTVSAPISWDEVAQGADGEMLSFGPLDVLARVEQDGDLFAAAATVKQELPGS